MRTILIEGVYYVEIYGMASERAVSQNHGFGIFWMEVLSVKFFFRRNRFE